MPRIVIVGAGTAGLGALQTLAKKLSPADSTDVVVLEKSAFFYHTYGASRAFVDAAFDKFMFIPFDRAIPANASGFVRLVRAVVTTVAADAKTLTYAAIGDDDQPAATATTLPFDYLILATGSTYTVPIKEAPDHFARAYTQRKLAEVRDHIARANSILVVGGGPLGCEVAGDIAAHYPTKHVTLLSSRPELVASDAVKDSFRTQLMETLASLGVRVVLGERLTERMTDNCFEQRTLVTDKGTIMTSDIQLLCAGFTPASDLVRGIDDRLVDAKGAIRVNDSLQLDDPAFAHVFAIGDATNHASPKKGYVAYHQGAHVATALAAVIKTKQETGHKPFPSVGSPALLLPLGPDRGVSQLPFFGVWVVGDWTTRWLVSKDMYVSRMWSALGTRPPP